MVFRVGLTGGIASGKSQVASLFSQHDIDVIDADTIARELVEPGTAYYQQVVELFGNECLLANKQLNRNYIRQLIFDNADLKEQLEQILHPAIRQSMLTNADQSLCPYVLIVVPLLFETDMQQLVDRTVTVDVAEKTQLQRLCNRDNLDIETAKKIMRQQYSREQRLQLSDDIIDNNGSLAILAEQVDNLHQRYMQFATLN